MSGARRSAAVLAALEEGDRTWILDHLDEHQRLRVEAELPKALLQPPSTLIAEISDAPRSMARTVAASDDADDVDTVRRAPREQIVDLVIGLPLIAIALLLDAERWPWANEVATRLKLDQRKQLPGLALEAKATVSVAVVPWLVRHLALSLRSASHARSDGMRFDAVFDEAASKSA